MRLRIVLQKDTLPSLKMRRGLSGDTGNKSEIIRRPREQKQRGLSGDWRSRQGKA